MDLYELKNPISKKGRKIIKFRHNFIKEGINGWPCAQKFSISEKKGILAWNDIWCCILISKMSKDHLSWKIRIKLINKMKKSKYRLKTTKKNVGKKKERINLYWWYWWYCSSENKAAKVLLYYKAGTVWMESKLWI